MALKQTFTFAGLTINDGYLRVTEVAGNKDRVAFSLSYQVAQGEDSIKTQSFDFAPDMSGGNFIEQAYQYLKTLPEFKSAQDC